MTKIEYTIGFFLSPIIITHYIPEDSVCKTRDIPLKTFKLRSKTIIFKNKSFKRKGNYD